MRCNFCLKPTKVSRHSSRSSRSAPSCSRTARRRRLAGSAATASTAQASAHLFALCNRIRCSSLQSRVSHSWTNALLCEAYQSVVNILSNGKIFCVFDWSGKGAALPPLPPLRTGRESFPSSGSSRYKAPRERSRYHDGLIPACWRVMPNFFWNARSVEVSPAIAGRTGWHRAGF